MKVKPFIVLLLSIIAAQATPVPAQADTSPLGLRLAENGRTDYVIALAEDAIPAEQTAAQELSDYLGQITGAVFPVKAEKDVAPDAAQILVGAGPRVRTLLPKQDWKALGHDGIVIRTLGRNLILAGGRPRGTLYAVYSLLQNAVGVRWWTPTESTVPAQRTLELPPQNTVFVPPISTREVYFQNVQRDPRFATRLKINGHHQRQGPELGGRNGTLGLTHTFEQLLPVSEYFKAHPEWFNDLKNGGKPSTDKSAVPEPHQWQLCLSNEGARRELTKNALAWLRRSPGAHAIAIAQNDNKNRCTCAADLALEQTEGSPSGPLLHFVNAVAAEIEKEFPDVLVETLAYQYTQRPPRIVRPRQNVGIRLCSVEADFSRPLDSDANAVFRDDLRGWSAITNKLMIWDYVTNFKNYILPYPDLGVLGPNIRFFVENKAISVFEQSDAQSNGTGDFVAMREWVLSQLLWDPNRDADTLINEFLRGYYGPAAPHLRAYLDTIQSAFERSGITLSIEQADHSYLTLDVMQEAARHYRAAEASVANDPAPARRVRRERLPLDHAWLLRNASLRREAQNRGVPFEGPADTKAFADEFIKTVREFGGNIPGFEKSIPALMARLDPHAPLPEFAQNRDESDVIDGQETRFRLHAVGKLSQIVDDPAASNGRAAKIMGHSSDWLIQYQPDESDEFLGGAGKWHCYIVARINAKPDAALNAGPAEKPVLAFGLYDERKKSEFFKSSLQREDIDPDGYQVIDAGTHAFNAGVYFWIAPTRREDIESITVDRILMVREK